MSLLSVEDFERVVNTGMDEDALQDVIDREEAELAFMLGGPLADEREESYYPPVGEDAPLWLRRYTDAVEVTDAGADVTVRLISNGGAIERADGVGWLGPVVVTYTPNDASRLRRALIELVRDVVVPDRDREAGSVRDDRDKVAQGRRASLVRGLTPRPRHGTLRVAATNRITAVSA